MTQQDHSLEPPYRKARRARLFDLHRQKLVADRPAAPAPGSDRVVSAAFAQIFLDSAARSLREKPRR